MSLRCFFVESASDALGWFAPAAVEPPILIGLAADELFEPVVTITFGSATR